MAATKADIRSWLDEGRKKCATHVVVACDTFDWSDYPVFVMPGEDAKKKASNLGEMQRLMEVYNLALDLESQLGEHRAFNY